MLVFRKFYVRAKRMIPQRTRCLEQAQYRKDKILLRDSNPQNTWLVKEH